MINVAARCTMRASIGRMQLETATSFTLRDKLNGSRIERSELPYPHRRDAAAAWQRRGITIGSKTTQADGHVQSSETEQLLRLYRVAAPECSSITW